MSDYVLINKLLEDGSPQAILKLKMIVDFDNFVFVFINYNNSFKFVMLFKENFGKIFKENPLLLRHIKPDKKVEILKIFKEEFEIGLQQHPRLLKDVPDNMFLEVLEMFNSSFKKVCEDSCLHIFDCIYENNYIHVANAYKDVFYNHFKNHSYLIHVITKNKLKNIFHEMFPELVKENERLQSNKQTS